MRKMQPRFVGKRHNLRLGEVAGAREGGTGGSAIRQRALDEQFAPSQGHLGKRSRTSGLQGICISAIALHLHLICISVPLQQLQSRLAGIGPSYDPV